MKEERRDTASQKGTKRLRTRARLIDAAAELFESDGIAATSLTEVAAAAGVTKGAIYSSFASKDDLVLAVMQDQPLTLAPRIPDGASRREILRAIGEAVVALAPAASTRGRLIAEYQLNAVTSPTLAARVAALHDQRIRLAIERLTPLWEASREPPASLSTRQLVVAVEALTAGFVQQRLLTPHVVTDDDVIATFEALAV